ncbi:Gfo/Idh/MocA family protein [Christiangramia aquimixticola]|uniref:Gfo/Idh/MocA family protein n=1 Tax=Christiangramia aquimixticola TaxID=1697558 RepID=UPI003AA8C2BB
MIKIKWGIIGLGKIAGKFATGLMYADKTELHAVASRDLEKAKSFAGKFNCKKYYGSYLELMQDEKIDVVYIATPHAFHHELSIQCLKLGKAVLCEKPFALNASQAQEMIDTARENNTFIMEALWTAFLPHFKHVSRIVNKKEYGEIRSLKADFGFPAEYDATKRLFNKSLGGGSLLDIGIYPVFLAYSLLGKPEEILAKAKMTETGVDLNCEIVFIYSNGRKIELFSTFEEKTKTMAEIEFEKARIQINSRFHEPTSITTYVNNKHEVRDFGVENNGYTYEAEHVNRMLQEKRIESNIWTHQNTLDLIQLLDEIRNKIGLAY